MTRLGHGRAAIGGLGQRPPAICQTDSARRHSNLSLIYLRRCLPTIRGPPNEGQFSARVRAVPAAAITTRPGRNGVSNPAATDNLLLKMLISREIDYVRGAAVVIKPVSANNLCKTGIFAEKARDFRQFRSRQWEIRSLETKSIARKAGISGPMRLRLQTIARRRTGWLATQC